MIRFRFIALMALTMVASTGAISAPVLPTPQAESPRRNALVLKSSASERTLTYLAPAAAVPATANSEEQSVQASSVEPGGENNAPAVFAVGLMIAAFTILRRLN